jgi:hypothetical protein
MSRSSAHAALLGKKSTGFPGSAVSHFTSTENSGLFSEFDQESLAAASGALPPVGPFRNLSRSLMKGLNHAYGLVSGLLMVKGSAY